MDEQLSEAISHLYQLISVMEMQEKRESEEFHIPQETAQFIWNEKKQAALSFLKELNESFQTELKALEKEKINEHQG